jgi:hypothetical protein
VTFIAADFLSACAGRYPAPVSAALLCIAVPASVKLNVSSHVAHMPVVVRQQLVAVGETVVCIRSLCALATQMLLMMLAQDQENAAVGSGPSPEWTGTAAAMQD